MIFLFRAFLTFLMLLFGLSLLFAIEFVNLLSRLKLGLINGLIGLSNTIPNGTIPIKVNINIGLLILVDLHQLKALILLRRQLLRQLITRLFPHLPHMILLLTINIQLLLVWFEGILEALLGRLGLGGQCGLLVGGDGAGLELVQLFGQVLVAFELFDVF